MSGSVGASGEQSSEATRLRIPRVLVGRLAVYARGSTLARAPIRLAPPIDVDVMAERGQCRLRHLARQFCYPLKFR